MLSATGASQLHCVAHSMGGMLAVGAVSRRLPCAGALRSLVLVSSGVFGGGGSWFAPLNGLIQRVCCLGFLAGHVVPWAASLRGPWRPWAWLTRSLFFSSANVDPPVGDALLHSLLSFIPPGLVRQMIGGLSDPRLGLASADGGGWTYADPRVLSRDARPVLAVCGDSDCFCPLAGALRTVNLFVGGGPARRRALVLGPRFGTARRHCGHFDPLMGRSARGEVWRPVADFLDEWDAPRSSWPPVAAAAVAAAAGTAGEAGDSAVAATGGESGGGESGGGESGGDDGGSGGGGAVRATRSAGVTLTVAVDRGSTSAPAGP